MVKDKRLKIEVSTDDHSTLVCIGDMFHALGRRTVGDYSTEGLQKTADEVKQMVEVGQDHMLVNGAYVPPLPVSDTLPPPAPPVTPPAPQSPVASPLGPELDSEGLPWDKRIHSSSKALIADGTWRLARGVDKGLVETVKAELKQVMAIKAPSPAAPAPTETAVFGVAGEAPVTVPMDVPGAPVPEPVDPAKIFAAPPTPVVPAPPQPQDVTTPAAPPVPPAPHNYSGAQSGGYTPTPPAPPVAPAPPVEPTPVTPTAPVTPVTPAGDAPTTFPAFLQRMTALQNEGKLTMDQVLQVLGSHGIPNPALLNAKRELIPVVFGQLMRVVGGETVEQVVARPVGGAA